MMWPARFKAWLQAHPMAAKVLGNSVWLALDRVLGLALALTVGIYVARRLGPEGLGYLQYALAVAGLVGGLSALGLPAVVSRELALARKPLGRLVGTALFLRSAAAVAAAVLLLVYAFTQHGPVDPARLLLIILAFGTLFLGAEVLEWTGIALHRSDGVALAKLPSTLLANAVRLGLALAGAPLAYFAGAEALAALLLSFGLLRFWRRHLQKGPLSFDAPLAMKLLRSSWPLALSTLMVAVYMRIDQVMIVRLVGPLEAGYYAAAVKLSEIWYAVPMALGAAALPALTQAWDAGPETWGARSYRLTRAMLLLSAPAMLLLWGLSPWAVPLLFGEAFEPALPMLRVHVWSGIFVAWGIAMNQALVGRGALVIGSFSTLGGAVLNVALNAWWIPRWGGLGASWATLVAYAFAVSVMPLFFARARVFPRLQAQSLAAALVWPFQALLKRENDERP